MKIIRIDNSKVIITKDCKNNSLKINIVTDSGNEFIRNINFSNNNKMNLFFDNFSNSLALRFYKSILG